MTIGKKVNKVPCIIGSIWGKILAQSGEKLLFGYFWCKNTLDICQKSRNTAWYVGSFWGKA